MDNGVHTEAHSKFVTASSEASVSITYLRPLLKIDTQTDVLKLKKAKKLLAGFRFLLLLVHLKTWLTNKYIPPSYVILTLNAITWVRVCSSLEIL